MIKICKLTLPPLGEAESREKWLEWVVERAGSRGVVLQFNELEQLWEDALDVVVHLSKYLNNTDYYDDPCYGCYKEDYCEIHNAIVYDQFEEKCDCWFGNTSRERLKSVAAAHIFAALLCQRHPGLAHTENNERG